MIKGMMELENARLGLEFSSLQYKITGDDKYLKEIWEYSKEISVREVEVGLVQPNTV